MKKQFLKILFICICLIYSCEINKRDRWCPPKIEEYIFIAQPTERHSGGVFVFNSSFRVDYSQIKISTLEKHLKLRGIIKNGASILKDSNTVEVTMFHKTDTVTIKEAEMLSEDAILVLCKDHNKPKDSMNEK